MRSPKKKIASILADLHKGLYEKEEVIRLCLLASVAGENVFLFGPPGTAKSLVCRRLKYAFENARSFEYLLNQFSVPDEIFGPLSIRRLKDDGVYERLTKGFLPEAEIVFLDEIWKAGSAILNSLLTAINEKVFKNGGRAQPIPLKLLAASSNELPQKEAGFEALWDRFLIRVHVGGIRGKRAFKDMLDADESALGESVRVRDPIRACEFEEWRGRLDAMRLGPYALNFMARLKRNIQKRNISKNDIHQRIYVSDRRWRKAARLVKASALLNGRKTPDLADCFALEKSLWDRDGQIAETEALLRSTMLEEGIVGAKALRALRSGASALKKEADRALTRTEDTRKTLPRRAGGYYSFCDPHTGQARFVKEADYEAAGPEARPLTLYKSAPLKTGYLGQSRHMLFKRGFDTFSSCGLDLERRWVPDRTVLFARNAKRRAQKIDISQNDIYDKNTYTPDIYPVSVDGKEAALGTVTSGGLYRVTRAPDARERGLWDRKADALLESARAQEKKLDRYARRYIKRIYTNLFVEAEKAALVREHAERAQKELEKAKLEILEARAYYRDGVGEKTLIL